MAERGTSRSPTQELVARMLRVVRTCPDASADVLELMFLVSQIEALTGVDREYRDARRVISRLRNPLWEMGPADREVLRKAAETIRRACDLKESDIPKTPFADLGERERIERHVAAALRHELDPVQVARVTGAVAAALQQ